MPTFYEFFAGGGMARAGLGEAWECLFANDLDPVKSTSYRRNWGAGHFHEGDVNALTIAMLPGQADLSWASFPCQDLSLAGAGKGIGQEHASSHTRSGTFWPYWRLMRHLARDGRPPRLLVLENVHGAITSHGGKDFAAIIDAIASLGYAVGAMVLDAALFLPHSRPRLFIIGAHDSLAPPSCCRGPGPHAAWHPASLVKALSLAADATRRRWRWWMLPEPPRGRRTLAHIVDPEPDGVAWHSTTETARLLSLMAPAHLEKVLLAQQSGRLQVGAVYRRTRKDENGQSRQRAEVRFDGLAGCLRTPAGGSSRQTLLFVQGETVRSRLLSPREAARLMGLPDSYVLPEKYNDAYKLAGDGVAAPVVSFLARFLLEPLLESRPAAADLADLSRGAAGADKAAA